MAELRDELAEAICRARLAWTRMATDPIVDPADYAEFYALADWLMPVIQPHLVTPEKAAVLDAAVARREHELMVLPVGFNANDIAAYDAEGDRLDEVLNAAVDALPDRTEEGR